MKIYKFGYRKEGSDTEMRSVVPLFENTEYLEGIALDRMSKEDKEKVLSIFREFDEKLSPYVKSSYRRFKRTQILSKIEESSISN